MKSISKMPGIAQIKEMRQDLKSTSPTNYHMNHFSTVFPTPALASSKSLLSNIPSLPLEPSPQCGQCPAQPSHCSQPCLIHTPHQTWATQLPSYHSVPVLAMAWATQVFPPDQNCLSHTRDSISLVLTHPDRSARPLPDQALLVLLQLTQRQHQSMKLCLGRLICGWEMPCFCRETDPLFPSGGIFSSPGPLSTDWEAMPVLEKQAVLSISSFCWKWCLGTHDSFGKCVI